jgi:hypothetical protein
LILRRIAMQCDVASPILKGALHAFSNPRQFHDVLKDTDLNFVQSSHRIRLVVKPPFAALKS